MITIDYLPSVNYSMMNNGVEVCNSLIVENYSDQDFHQLLVQLIGPYIKESSCRLEILKSGEAIQVNQIKIEPDIKILSEITEAVRTSFVITVRSDEGLLFEQEYPITLLSYEEWAGSAIMPEHLAAFVVPNNPYLPKIKLEAAKFLEQWTGSSAFDEYQTQDRNRVRAQVAAIYEALRSQGIIYSAPPASFEQTGQRIRMADKVLTEKIGTCLDTSLLVASCLEEIGIFPIILMLKGHAMVGAWLIPNVFPQMVCDDASYLLKEMADGNNNLVLLESTFITSSGPVSFEEAAKSAMLKLNDESQFLYFLDIHRCRLGNVKPMPQRIQVNGEWTFINEGIEHENATESVSSLSHFDLRLEDTGKPTTKQMIWERKLLDFSLRNNLLNTRLGRKVIPFISFDIEHLEDHLQKNEDYSITPSPGKKIEPNDDGMYDSKQQATEYETFVSELIQDHKIASYLTQTELQNALKYVYRTARTSLEENGANSLFLALGILKWYETSKSEQPRYAPILLMPVDIVRKSGNNYIIRKRDEDLVLNITLVELLKQNFQINLEGLNELPKDEFGVDVKMVFTYFRRAIIEQKKWNVIEESMLGLFSFNKFVMWNDIHSNADKLRENVIVDSLMDNHDKQEVDTNAVDARVIDKECAPMDFAIPLDVDSSQMEAIVESGRGRSFILHGPPGTGKSQTITNMIANALYQGKRVLFVAEKMAALSVVQARLEKINLAPFCLELHSNKATKKHFLEQMDQVLKVTKIKSPEEYARRSEELYNERKELISYMEALHRKGPNGLSLYECISRYISIEEEECCEQLPPKAWIRPDYIDRCLEQVEQTNTILDIVGTPGMNALNGLEPIDNKNSTLDSLQALLTEFKNRYSVYLTQLGKLNALIPFDLKTDADLQWLERFVNIINTEKNCDEMRDNILASHNQNILTMDVNTYQREWQKIKSKWFLPRYFAKKNFLQSLQSYGPFFESNIDSVFKKVSDYQETLRRWTTQTEEITSFAYTHGFSHQDRYELYRRFLGDQTKGRRQEFLLNADAVMALNNELTSLTDRIAALAPLQHGRLDLIMHVDDWLNHYRSINDWYHWVDKKREMTEMHNVPVVEMIERGIRPEHAMNAFLKGIYHELIKEAVDANEQLRMFNGLKFRQQIEKYKRDTVRFQELSKEELYSKLASRVPSTSTSVADGSEISILKRNIANGGRGNSIRSIIDNIPTLLPRLCPCMLMSPISVAQYIDMNSEKFDLVIFDEASQMPTSEAVGAIARGKALIVVGDSKQMPPTSFFTTNQVEEEEADIDDMESILDDCITLSLCEHQLNWHYRSKHESLIAFSNSQYYGNKLLTFPSIDDRTAKVTLVPINGVYDKGRTRSNPEESKAIVDEIIRRLSDPILRSFSIGVVAFSRVQGDLIEDDLTEALDKNPQLKEIAYNDVEPIFVKNLENVQGDERDVILFSIGYGADKNGKVSMNFGPLNNAGGERRLNVAVSRARYEMMVFSTLRSSQIDLKRSNAKGVEGLKAFLEYAETGRLPFISSSLSNHSENNVMVQQICTALDQAGYVTEMFVGRSDFKVDIAVATREHPDQYILGILCDGKTYYETKTTRDREIVQPNVLRMLQWRVMRVYSIDWYENQERALNQILDELKLAEAGVFEKEEQEETASYVFDAERIKDSGIVDEVTRNKAMLPYRECIIPFAVDKDSFNPYDQRYAVIVKRIVQDEQPITEDYLCKRLAKVMGFGHAGSNIQKLVSSVVSSLYRDPLSIDGEYSFWLNKASAQGYLNYRAPSPRNITEIPAIEIVNAIREVVEEEFSLPKDKIPTIAARKLGFASSGAKINEVIMAALNLMEQNGIVKTNNDSVSLI
ncbi:MAG: DUF4011 domain-containing protein [Bacteroidales bacterium]|nr:DUF4011 domain-containing protein [Bacteroidales bacterium]